MEETVNKNIEKYQTPSWRGHPSLLGWCQMNYPASFIDRRQKREPSPRKESSDLNFMHQRRPASSTPNKIYKPLTNAAKNKPIIQEEKVGVPPKGFKSSTYTLTTTPLEHRTFLMKEMTKDPNLTRARPLSCGLGHQDFKTRFEKKIPQVGEIKYHEEPEDEERRHLKRLPNSILTEQSLKEILSDNLEYLNLSNLMWVKNEHLNKLGFVAPNLTDLNISGTVANDFTIEELGKTLINLKAIDISNCFEITEKGVAAFLSNCQNLEKFWASNCTSSVTDDSLSYFRTSEKLTSLNIEFCSKVTDESLRRLVDVAPPLKELHLSGCIYITGKTISALLEKSHYQLEVAELSNLTQTEFDNETLKAVGSCGKLKRLNISGSYNIGDDGIHNLVTGIKENEDTLLKKEEGFKHMIEFRMGALKAHSEAGVIKLCNTSPNIEILDLNGFNALGEIGLSLVCKALPKLRVVLINFTDKISNTYLAELAPAHPNVNFARATITHSDPKDTGLRVPFPKIQTGKKKKKGKKKK